TANLWISMTDLRLVMSVLQPIATDHFDFAVASATGRAYRIESSLDLRGWTPEESFGSDSVHYPAPGWNRTSVVRSPDSISALELVKISDRKYFRVSRYTPANEICNMNLQLIRFGKELHARAVHVAA